MAKKPKTQNRFGNSNIPTPSTTQEKPAISPLMQQVTGEIFNKEQEALLAKEDILREEILVIIERCKQVQEDLQLEKQQYEEKNRSLLEQQTELNLRNTELAHKEQKVKSDIENLDKQVILALMMGAIRAERFCNGALLGFFEDGYMLKWLKRLKEIDTK